MFEGQEIGFEGNPRVGTDNNYLLSQCLWGSRFKMECRGVHDATYEITKKKLFKLSASREDLVLADHGVSYNPGARDGLVVV